MFFLCYMHWTDTLHNRTSEEAMPLLTMLFVSLLPLPYFLNELYFENRRARHMMMRLLSAAPFALVGAIGGVFVSPNGVWGSSVGAIALLGLWLKVDLMERVMDCTLASVVGIGIGLSNGRRYLQRATRGPPYQSSALRFTTSSKPSKPRVSSRKLQEEKAANAAAASLMREEEEANEKANEKARTMVSYEA